MNSPSPKLHFGMLLALVHPLYRPRIRREFAWIFIDGTIRRNGRRLNFQARHGLCALCTKRGITFFNSQSSMLHFGMVLALVQTLYRPKIRREFARISINGTILRNRWRPHFQARHGLCALYTKSGITFCNPPYLQLHLGVLLALVQFAWISIDGTIRWKGLRPNFQASHGLCAFYTKRGLHFSTLRALNFILVCYFH